MRLLALTPFFLKDTVDTNYIVSLWNLLFSLQSMPWNNIAETKIRACTEKTHMIFCLDAMDGGCWVCFFSPHPPAPSSLT